MSEREDDYPLDSCALNQPSGHARKVEKRTCPSVQSYAEQPITDAQTHDAGGDSDYPPPTPTNPSDDKGDNGDPIKDKRQGKQEPPQVSGWLKANVIINSSLSFLLIVATGLSAYFIWGQWGAMNEALRIAKNQVEIAITTSGTATTSANAVAIQVDIMKHQLELSERPWVFAKVEVGGPLTYDVNGAKIVINIRLKNTGHSPALLIIAEGKFLISQDHDWNAVRDKLCGSLQYDWIGTPAVRRVFSSYTVPPRGTLELWQTLYSMPDELQRGIESEQRMGQKREKLQLFPHVVFCVDYQFPFVLGEHHHTGYIFELWRRTPTVDHPIAFEALQNVPRDEVILAEKDSSDIN